VDRIAFQFVLISHMDPKWTNVVIAQAPSQTQTGQADSSKEASQRPTLRSMRMSKQFDGHEQSR
jgi:hypothetical protein